MSAAARRPLPPSLQVHNTGDQAFEFTASLHSYFGVTDIDAAAVRGLQGLEYLDRVGPSALPWLSMLADGMPSTPGAGRGSAAAGDWVWQDACCTAQRKQGVLA